MRRWVLLGGLVGVMAGCGGGGGGETGSANPNPSPNPNPPPSNPYIPSCLNGHYFSFVSDVRIVDRQTLQELPKTSDGAYLITLGQKVYMMVPYSTDAKCMAWSVSVLPGSLTVGSGQSSDNPLKISCEYTVREDGYRCEGDSGGAYRDALLLVEACVQDLVNSPFPEYCDTKAVRISLR